MNNREKWDRRFLELAKHISWWSKDPSTKVGAVLVDDANHVVGTGYNGFPAGTDDSPELYLDRELKYRRVVHAEVNAILIAGFRAKGTRLYVYPSFAIPNICCECCKIAIQAGIKEIIGYEPEEHERLLRKRSDGSCWADSIAVAKNMCDEAGVIYYSVK